MQTDLILTAKKIRVDIIQMLTESKSGHPGGSLSSVEILTALWFKHMQGVSDPHQLPSDRDRFILSKGHGVPTLYAILAQLGYIQKSELMTLRKLGSRLQGHPDRNRLPIVEACTGSLGQGLSVAQGIAIANKMDGKKGRVFCLLGDGEIQEGQIWEAALSAPKFKLSNLCAILDHNKGQIDGPVEKVMPLTPLKEKWEAFGWNVVTIDGHNFDQIDSALSTMSSLQDSQKPFFIIANTVKGKGVSFMENKIEWHGVAPKPEEAKKAIEEILK